MLKVLLQLNKIEGDQKDKDIKAFRDTMQNIQKFAQQADAALNTFIKSEENWFYSTLLKAIR
ncbi:hypothetical protein [Chitinophaga sp. XS-30]|uniref:hypothetical protein n=1 Tax=Chitinophaga sp. XS-30 TaxID=2604421 RepID=UPI001FEEC3EE|nr:hypothetical protein [Chitinophaga sp. XS-30]